MNIYTYIYMCWQSDNDYNWTYTRDLPAPPSVVAVLKMSDITTGG
jgi:hypothetical protein